MGRPIKYTDEERKNAVTKSKTKYMLNKEWLCIACDNYNYTMAGKWSHIHTKKHKKNYIKMNIKFDDVKH